jgi:fructose PTS system EIIBC or EIIC component
MKFVAVTSCPTGIAHTYMAAEGLEQAAKAAGDEIVVETQGSAGSTPLDPAVIAEADAVIFAADVEVRNRERFAGKPLVQAGVKRAISAGPAMIEEARAAAAAGPPAGAATPAAATAGGGGVSGEAGFGTKLRGWLMTGVSYVIPFVAAGGLLIALSFALGGYKIVDFVPEDQQITDVFQWGEKNSWAALMLVIGQAAFGFLVPILAGFIAFAMADRPALVPGIVGGFIAVEIEAGFLGGLVAGLLAGAVVMQIKRVQVPRAVAGIMPVVVIPLLSTFLVGAIMFVVIGKPIAGITNALTDWLNGLSGTNAIFLGILLGLMMAFDMGGPVNKTAYAFAVAGLSTGSEGSLKVMAAVMAAGMVPPLALALSTMLRPSLYTESEHENGRAAWVLGASFISEGAIPFAAADPVRVIPSIMAGGAVTGALSMAFDSTLRAPHGGIFVVPLIGNPLLYLLAIAAGTGVGAALVIVLKSFHRKGGDVEGADPLHARATAAA